MIEWMNDLVAEGIALGRIVIVLVAIMSVIITFYRTQALVPVLSAVFVAGVAIWAVSPAGLAQLETWVGEDTSAAFSVTELDALVVSFAG